MTIFLILKTTNFPAFKKSCVNGMGWRTTDMKLIEAQAPSRVYASNMHHSVRLTPKRHTLDLSSMVFMGMPCPKERSLKG